MKTKETKLLNNRRLPVIATGILLACLAAATAVAQEPEHKIVVTASAAADADGDAPQAPVAHKQVIIRRIEPEAGKSATKEMTWLGVAVEEVPEALSAQLGLKSGEGLVVSYVSKDSPAAAAELRKNDVLVELEGQMLVDPVQLRKLVQMHPDGDGVKVTFYRSGKKQSVTAKLVKKSWNETSLNEDSLPDGGRKMLVQLRGVNGDGSLDEQMKVFAESMARYGVDKGKMKVEIERSVEQARKAIQDAMQNSQIKKGHDALGSVSKELAELASRQAELAENATVIVKSRGSSSKSLVKTDENGSYVIVADPTKHLTAHDKEGKLLFDGAIESPEQQQKVPADVWEKVKPLLEEIDSGKIEVKEPIQKTDALGK